MINLFKNSRLVWLNNVSEVSHVSEEDDAVMNEEESAAELMGLLQQLENRCSAAAKGGQEAIDRQLCSLAEAEEYSGMLKVKQLVNDLGEKYLNTLQGEDSRYQTKDLFERGRLMEEITDFDALMENAKKCESYEIIPYPGKIIFIFPDGETEEMPLEFVKREKKDAIGRGLRSLRREQEDEKNKNRAIGRGLGNLFYEQVNEIRNQQSIDQQDYLEELVAEAAHLTTPEAAYKKVQNLAPSLDEDLLKKISGPLSEAADIWSQAQMSYDDGYASEGMGAGRIVQLEHISSRIDDAFVESYGRDYQYDMNEEQMNELAKIEDTFGVGI